MGLHIKVEGEYQRVLHKVECWSALQELVLRGYRRC